MHAHRTDHKYAHINQHHEVAGTVMVEEVRATEGAETAMAVVVKETEHENIRIDYRDAQSADET